jgi:hypothetical protein
MATYKLIQDIEAEDKILGPLSLRQFIYGLISALFLYISFLVLNKGAPYLLILFLPPALFTGFFAFPFGGDQPTEVWALARIRFIIKPHKRLWDQSGVKELVTITVPKKVDRNLTNGLSTTEVKSRLSALANTIDSRGWAVKNVNVNLYSQPNIMASDSSDRLISLGSMPQEVPNYDVQAADDILDTTNNPIAQKFDSMIQQATQTHRQQLVDQMNAVVPERPQPAPAQAPANDYWFLNQAELPKDLPKEQAVFTATDLIHPDPIAVIENRHEEEVELHQRLQNQNMTDNAAFTNLRTLQPLVSLPPAPEAQITYPQPVATTQPVVMSPTTDPAIISLSNNNDLNISTLAREAQRTKNPNGSGNDEVSVSLR